MKRFLSSILAGFLVGSAFCQSILSETSRLGPRHTGPGLGYARTAGNYGLVFGPDDSIRADVGGDFFGASLSMTDVGLLVGASGQSSALYYEKNTVTGAWDYEAIFHSRGLGASFGAAVSLSTSRFLIGTPDYQLSSSLNHGNAFFAELATRSEILSFQAGDNGLDATVIGHQKLGYPNDFQMFGKLSDQSFFGSAVDHDGSVAIVGAPSESLAGGGRAGGAYLYDISVVSGGSQDAPTSAIRLNPLVSLPVGAEFGAAVSLSGDLAVVGSPGYDAAGGVSDAGLAFVFRKTNSGSWIYDSVLNAPSALPNWRFGTVVEISDEHIFISEPGPLRAVNGVPFKSGKVHIFRKSDRSFLETLSAPFGQKRFGASLAARDDVLIVGAPGDRLSIEPEALVYRKNAAGNFVLAARLVSTNSVNDTATDFGISVALSDTQVAVGAPLEDLDGIDHGGVYLFELSATLIPSSVSAFNVTVTYDGTPKEIIPTTTPRGLSVSTTYSPGSIPPTDAGAYQVTFQTTQAGYIQSTTTATLTIERADEQIILPAVPPLRLGDAAFPLNGRTTNHLRNDALSFFIADPSVATVANGAITPVGVGSTTIRAALPLDSNFVQGIPVTIPIIVEDPNAPRVTSGVGSLPSPPGSVSGLRLGTHVAIDGDFAVASSGGTGPQLIVTYRRSLTGEWQIFRTLDIGPGEIGDLDFCNGILAVSLPESRKIHVYELDGLAWNELDELTGAPSFGSWGRSLNVDQRGQIQVAYYNHNGDPLALAGALVRNYRRQGNTYVLSQVLPLTFNQNPISFGDAISDDRDLLVVTGSRDQAGAGVIWLYRYDEATASYLLEDATAPLGFGNYRLGSSVTIRGNLIYASAPNAYADDAGQIVFPADPDAVDRGVVGIVRFDPASGFLFPQSYLSLPGAQAGRFDFGKQIAIADDGSLLATSSAIIAGAEVSRLHLLQAAGEDYVPRDLPDPLSESEFAADIAAAGEQFIIGFPLGDQGEPDSGHVNFLDTTLRQMLGPDLIEPGFAGAQLESKVACQGSQYAVGFATSEVEGRFNAGKVLVYDFFAGIGAPVQILIDPSGAANTLFGRSVTMRGNYLFVGAPGVNKLHIFEREGDRMYQFKQSLSPPQDWSDSAFGTIFDAEATTPEQLIAVGSPGAARVDIFRYNLASEVWAFHETLTGPASSDYGASLSFGRTTTPILGGPNLAIGAPFDGAGTVRAMQWNPVSESLGIETTINKPSFAGDQFGKGVAYGLGFIAATSATSNALDAEVHTIRVNGDIASYESSTLLPQSDGLVLDALENSLLVSTPTWQDEFVLQGGVLLFEREGFPGSLRLKNEIRGTAPRGFLGVSAALCENFAIFGSLYKEPSNLQGYGFLILGNPTLNTWSQQFSLAGLGSLPLSDADGDGRANLLSYALGVPPVGPQARLIRERLPKIVRLAGKSAAGFSLPDPVPVGLVYRVQVTCDLATWETLATKIGPASWEESGATITETHTGSLTEITVTPTSNLGSPCFYRLSVDLR